MSRLGAGRTLVDTENFPRRKSLNTQPLAGTECHGGVTAAWRIGRAGYLAGDLGDENQKLTMSRFSPWLGLEEDQR